MQYFLPSTNNQVEWTKRRTSHRTKLIASPSCPAHFPYDWHRRSPLTIFATNLVMLGLPVSTPALTHINTQHHMTPLDAYTCPLSRKPREREAGSRQGCLQPHLSALLCLMLSFSSKYLFSSMTFFLQEQKNITVNHRQC